MTLNIYNFRQAFQRALQVLKGDLEQALQDYGEQPRSWKRKQRYFILKEIVEKLDSLL